jgi:SAM-dependent methyltransferase
VADGAQLLGRASERHDNVNGRPVHGRLGYLRLSSRYDDEIWELVPADAGAPPAHLVAFVRSLEADGRVLDLGAGDGRLSAELGARAPTLADVSQVALERAALRLPEARTVQLEPDAPLPLADSAFDLVLCAETLEHVRDVQLLLSEARRVLAPGGTLAVTTPAHGRLSALAAAVRGFEHAFDPLSPHLRFFTARSLRRVLDAMGFDVTSVRTRTGTLMTRATR